MSAQKLDDKEVEQLLRAGRTQVEIVRLYHDRGVEVTQSAISQAISTGRIKMDTGRSTGGIQWTLNREHRHLNHARMLRSQARLDSGLPIGATLVPQLEAWRRSLEKDDAVIHYDPDTDEGFWRVPRRPGVDLWWVREPTLDDDGMTVRNAGATRPFGARQESDDPATEFVERRPSRLGPTGFSDRVEKPMIDKTAAIADQTVMKLFEAFDLHLHDTVTGFAVNAGVSAARVEAIGHGEEATSAELDDLGFGYIDLLRSVAKDD